MKISRHSEDRFFIVWMIYRQSGRFLSSLEDFPTVSNMSGQSGNFFRQFGRFLNSLEDSLEGIRRACHTLSVIKRNMDQKQTYIEWLSQKYNLRTFLLQHINKAKAISAKLWMSWQSTRKVLNIFFDEILVLGTF